jgi:hypothetical protein
VRISELHQKQSHWTIESDLYGTPEKLATVGGFMNRTIPVATELKASAGSEPTRDTQDDPHITTIAPMLVACLLLLSEDADAILSFLRGLAVNGRALHSDKATNENTLLRQSACQDLWLGHSEAAAYLGVSESALYHYSCHEQIERHKLLVMAVGHHVFDAHLDAMRKVVS